jgi:hypothetical protein
MDTIWGRCPSCARWFACPELGLTDAYRARCPNCATPADLLWDRDDGIVLTVAQVAPSYIGARGPRSLLPTG